MDTVLSAYTEQLAPAWRSVPGWLGGGEPNYTDEQRAAIEGYERALFAHMGDVKPRRFAHSISVGLTAERIARLFGVSCFEARVAGILHDWAKVLSAREEISRARALGIELGVSLELVEPLLHGMVAARELPARFPEVDSCVWQAIERHTLGAQDMSPLDMVVFVADGVEPLRPGASAIERQRALVRTTSLEDLFFACFTDGMAYVLATGRYLYPGTLDIYNSIALERAQARERSRI